MKNAIEDVKVIEAVKEIISQGSIYNERGEQIGVKTEEYGDLMISQWEEELLAEESNNVEFKIPNFKDRYLKFVPETPSLRNDGKIIMLLNYWRRGIFLKSEGNPDVLITRCYRHKNNDKTEQMPLGEKVTGKIMIKKSRNIKTGEERIILEHVYIPGEIANKRVLIDGQNVEKKLPQVKELPQVEVPGTNGKLISVVHLKK